MKKFNNIVNNKYKNQEKIQDRYKTYQNIFQYQLNN